MSREMTRPIGEIFEYRKIKLQVVENNGCEGCYFEDKNCPINYPTKTGWCGDSTRDDRKSVIFKRINK